jgi:hypothetical protein
MTKEEIMAMGGTSAGLSKEEILAMQSTPSTSPLQPFSLASSTGAEPPAPIKRIGSLIGTEVWNAVAAAKRGLSIHQARTGTQAASNALKNLEIDSRNRLFAGEPVKQSELDWLARVDTNMATIIQSRKDAGLVQIAPENASEDAQNVQDALTQEENRLVAKSDWAIPTPEAKTGFEKVVQKGSRFGSNVGVALGEVLLFKKAMPGLPTIAAFEMQNQTNPDAIPGEGALMYTLMAGAGKLTEGVKATSKLGKLGKELLTTGAETAAVAAIPAAKQAITGEKQDWSFLLLPAILRTPRIIRAGWDVGASSLPNIRDIMPVEPSLGPTIESARAQKLLPAGTSKFLLTGQQAKPTSQPKALPMSYEEQVSRAAAQLYDDLVAKAPESKAAAKDLEKLSNGYYLPKLETLQEKAIAGDQAAVDAIRAGEYYGGEHAGAASLRKAVIDRKLVPPPKPGKVKAKDAEAGYRRATEVAAVPEAPTPQPRGPVTAREALPKITPYRGNLPPETPRQGPSGEIKPVGGTLASPPPVQEAVELPKGLPEAVAKLTEWVPKAKVFTKGTAARKIRDLRAKQAQTSQEIFKTGLEQGMSPAEAAQASRSGMKQQADVPEYAPPALGDEGWAALKNQAAKLFAEKPFDRVNALEALDKIQAGRWLAKHEYKYLDPIIGEEATKALWEMAQKSGGFGILDTASRISGLSKCFVGTDMQLGYQFSDAWASHPIIVTRGLLRGLKSEVSRKQLNKIVRRVRNDPLFEEAAEVINFRTSKPWGELGMKGRPEQYAGGGGEYLTGLWKDKGIVKKTAGLPARAYGRLLRWREERFSPIANSILLDLYKAERPHWANIKDPAQRAAAQKAYGTHINTLTRLLEMGGKDGPGIQKVLNMVLFSTSSTISRPMQIINMATNKGARVAAGKALAANILKIHLTGALVNLFGQWYSLVTGKEPPFSMGVNSIGSDYGKLRVGNSYFDPTFGLAGMFRSVARLAMAAEAKAERIGFGRIRTTVGGETIPTAWETITGYFTAKESPWIGLVRSLATGKDYAGKDIGPVKALASVLVPTQAQAFLEALEDDGATMAMIAAAAEQMSMPVLTYPDSPGKLRAQARDRVAKETFNKPWDELGESEHKALMYKNYQLFKDLDEMVKDENKRNPRDYTKAKMEEVDAGDLVKSKLPKGARDLLKDYPLTVSRTYGTVRLNDAYYNKLIDYTAKELSVRIGSESFKNYSPEYRRQVLDLMTKEATRWAWMKLRAELKLY